ncbi:MAG: hypothetical protein DWP94_11355 [Flavobacterium sp.]|nr:MAG: hypothetical protein DWP94_11355 [Flavobacterium sp.]
MNCTIKKIVLLLLLALLFSSCIIQNPKPEDCDVKEIIVAKIYEGGTLDIVFAEENGDFYYINRGLEQGFTLSEMEEIVLNKKVTLHLAKVITGTSNHIAQLALEEDVIYTEFK